MYNYNRSQKYDKSFLSQNFMGPNAILMLDEITQDIALTMNMRVLVKADNGKYLNLIAITENVK